MKNNMSNTDRMIRIIIAVTVAVLYFGDVVTGTWGIVTLIVGAIALATAAINFCPLYKLLGIKTSK
jgi:hypothetical protein